jgi:ABC-type multidrug transport system ATPase subunit
MPATMGSLLSFDRVSKSHWRGAHELAVLSEVSFGVGAGELFAIWGHRGSGKTTLARLAVGRERPDGGIVRFRDRELSFPRDLHREIGWVRRSGARTDEMPNVASYLMLPLLDACSPSEAKRRAVAMLDRVGIADCAELSWRELTDGQRTLVAIAHALVREPSLLVADDPTASLNLLQREEIMRLLRMICDEDGLGVLVTVPDMPEMAHADQIAMLSDRHLVFPPPKSPASNIIDFPAGERSA